MRSTRGRASNAPPRASDAVDAFLSHALAGNPRAATCLALGLLERGVPSHTIIVDLLAAAQHRIGERWLRNEATVADEHLVSGATQRALDALADALEPPMAHGMVVVTCAEGDWHALAAQLFAELLRADGFQVAFLGASTPADHVSAYLARSHADAVVVSCSLPMFFPGVARLAETSHRHGMPVMAGGRALGTGPDRAVRLGADGWAADLAQASRILRYWQEQEPPAAGPLTPDSAALHLDRVAPSLGEQAFQGLAAAFPRVRSFGQDQVARTKEDLVYIARFVAAALLVEDPLVFMEFLDWLATLLAARAVPVAALAAGLSALAPLLEAADNRAGALVAAGLRRLA